MINQILLRGVKVFLHWSVNAIKNKNKQTKNKTNKQTNNQNPPPKKKPTINIKERQKRIKTKPKKTYVALINDLLDVYIFYFGF